MNHDFVVLALSHKLAIFHMNIHLDRAFVEGRASEKSTLLVDILFFRLAKKEVISSDPPVMLCQS